MLTISTPADRALGSGGNGLAMMGGYLVQNTYRERNTDTKYLFVARGEFGIMAGSVTISCMVSSQRKIDLDCQPEEQFHTEIYERSRLRHAGYPELFPLTLLFLYIIISLTDDMIM